MIHRFVVPECYGDTALIDCLGYREPNHKKGVGNVINTFKEKGFDGRNAVGIIDNDKSIQGQLKALSKIESNEFISFYNFQGTNHFLIVLSPAVDGFILECCKQSDLSCADYNLPTDLLQFKNAIKDENVGRMQDFKNLLAELKKKNPAPIATLKAYLEHAVGPPLHYQHFS